MDPERTFLRVHVRLSVMLAQLISPRLKSFLENLCLVVAISLLTLLAVMHVNFVSQAGCANELSHDRIAEAELLQIKMVEQGLWSKTTYSGLMENLHTNAQSSASNRAEKSSLTTASWLRWLSSCVSRGLRTNSDKLRRKAGGDYSEVADTNENMDNHVEREAEFLELWDSWALYSATWLAKVGDVARRFAKFWRNAGRGFPFSNTNYGGHAFSEKHNASAEGTEKHSDAFEPLYMYSVQRGYLLLPDDVKARHNVYTMNISMSARNACFGNRWQQLLINSLVGYDTILMNSLLEARGEGYLYNYQTKELYNLNYPREGRGVPGSFQAYVISKCGVLIMSLFVFFTTTMSVSFTLRETQARMLKFTVQLQYHVRHQLPAFRLIFIHVIESLVFVPIMIGILFFLFEFYEDQLLAFLVLMLVWLCELFTMISVRTSVSMLYFPRFFFLYFVVFHIYFFSYEYGFSYLAFSTTGAFMQHLVLYFWNRFEVPVLQRYMRSEMHFQEMRAPPSAAENAGNLSFLQHLRRNPSSGASLIGATRGNVDDDGDDGDDDDDDDDDGMWGNIRQIEATSRTRQRPLDASPLNPFGSILLWILGGPSVHLSSYIRPMFRDVDHHHRLRERSPSPRPPSSINRQEAEEEEEEEEALLRRRIRTIYVNNSWT